MPKTKTTKITSAPVVQTWELVRKSYDYERDEVACVFASLDGGRNERVVKYSITEAAKKLQKQDDQANAWFIAEAQARGVIPAGTVA